MKKIWKKLKTKIILIDLMPMPEIIENLKKVGQETQKECAK